MANFHLNIVSALETVFSGEATALTLPGAEGYFGLLAHHAPIVAVLGEGEATLRVGTKETTFHIKGGFLEMSNNVCTLLPEEVRGLDHLKPAAAE
ncbi:MAG: F0F1 ATP synthase subunit epsilon [Sumerlaeia bacterium]